MRLQKMRLRDLPAGKAQQSRESRGMYLRALRALRAFERSGHEAAEVLELGRRTPNEVYKGMYAMARKYAPGVKMRQYGDRIFMIRRDADEDQHRVRAGKR